MASLFSKIIAGDIPGCFLFQDTHWIGLLDLFPVSPGHLLLIPRHEAARWTELPAAVLADYGQICAKASSCLYAALKCDALSILLRDGAAAGQEIPHVHVHLVPRYEGDQPHAFGGGSYGPDQDAAIQAMNDMRDRLAQHWQA